MPQGTADMNTCIEVSWADAITQHENSMRIGLPDAEYFIKADSVEDIRW